MYDFIDINESSRRYSLPSEALILNGKVIEDVINGYQTLTVSGRELISSELNVERKQHNDGSIYIDKSYPPRTITIQYKLKAKTPEEFRWKFEELNKLLMIPQSSLRFRDDLDHHFIGTMESVDEIPPGTDSVIGNFSFYCADPYKYKIPIKLSGQKIIPIFDDSFKTYPTKIIITPSKNVEELLITSGSNEIRLVDATFLKDQPIILDFKSDQVDVSGGELSNISPKNVSYNSDLESFRLYNNVPVELKQDGKLELIFSEVAL